ncbi:hypothetical protein C8J57DRAFT_1507251 [Mycena rebaudengoi]|nr:hypothetical protein C8J57DRAFT_1507251 [Mycena rebaudengoi]
MLLHATCPPLPPRATTLSTTPLRPTRVGDSQYPDYPTTHARLDDARHRQRWRPPPQILPPHAVVDGAHSRTRAFLEHEHVPPTRAMLFCPLCASLTCFARGRSLIQRQRRPPFVFVLCEPRRLRVYAASSHATPVMMRHSGKPEGPKSHPSSLPRCSLRAGPLRGTFYGRRPPLDSPMNIRAFYLLSHACLWNVLGDANFSCDVLTFLPSASGCLARGSARAMLRTPARARRVHGLMHLLARKPNLRDDKCSGIFASALLGVW